MKRVRINGQSNNSMSIPDFLGAFYFYKTEALTNYDGKAVNVECEEIGILTLPTGQIVACDGLIPDLDPFVQQVMPGTYPVILSVAILDDNYWIACAMLRFSETMPQVWKPAVTAKQNSQQGYGVDTAIGCFADLTAMELLSADEEKYKQLQEKVYQSISEWTNFYVSDVCNILAFSSGKGDGRYLSYFGYDADENAVCLATDFGIIAPLPGNEAEEPNEFQLNLDF